MNQPRRDLPPIPPMIAKLPVDSRGYPVPWFVAWIDGKPEFRVADGAKAAIAVTEKRCWVCGGPLGRNFAFVIGPMCAVNRVSSEPPSHAACAIFSAKACPFLTKPQMRRREGGLPDDCASPGGDAILRNPGVTLVWHTRDYKVERVHNGVIFRIGSCIMPEWFAEGRTATRDEVFASIRSGLPSLSDPAAAEGPRAMALLERMLAEALKLLPKATVRGRSVESIIVDEPNEADHG